MASITLQGNEIHTVGELPATSKAAPAFSLTNASLEDVSLESFKGVRLVLNIIPSVDTGVCAASAMRFSKEAGALENTKILTISQDLPFAQGRFCAAQGIDNVVMLSGFRNDAFGDAYGVTIKDGPFGGLYSRAVVVLDENHQVIYTEQVPEIATEPDYDEVLKHLS